MTNKVEKPVPEWSIVELAGWFEEFTEKPTYSDSWRYKQSFSEHESIRLFKELINRCVRLEEDLAGQRTEAERLHGTVNSHIRNLREKQAEIDGLNVQLQSKQREIAELNQKLSKPASLWSRLVTQFPNFLADGEAKIQKLEKEVKVTKTQATQSQNNYQSLVSQYNNLSAQFEGLQNQQRQDKQSWNAEKKSLNDQLEKLHLEYNQQMAEIARLKETKQAESVGDYEKREGYQIVTDYKAFCTQQSLEVITEDIYGYLYQRRKELQDATKRDLFLAQTKATLSKVLLVDTYKTQVRRLRSKQPLLEFEVFFESHGKSLLSQLDLSEELGEQLKRTAKKGFDLVTQLVTKTPPCLLFTADEGDMFNSEEHEVAAGCPKEGVIQFTVVPGVQSGYQLLMKPVVFTAIHKTLAHSPQLNP